MDDNEIIEQEPEAVWQDMLDSFPPRTIGDHDAELAQIMASDDYTFDQKLEFTLLHARAVESIRRRNPDH